MSVPITDKADNMSKLVDNLNIITNEVNEQLDPSVLANLTTKVKDTLVNAINELNQNKISREGDITFLGDIIAESFSAKNYEVGFDENGNSYIDFIDAKTNIKVHFGWNESRNNWVISDKDGNIYDILTGASFDFNKNNDPLLLKGLNQDEIETYIGPEREVVINTSNYQDIRIQDGVTAGGKKISGSGEGSVIKIRRIS